MQWKRTSATPTTPGTRKNALDAVRLIFENLDTAYTDGNNIEARRNMLALPISQAAPSPNLTLDMSTQLHIPLVENIMFHTDLPMQ